jgi:hypothetical protein
MVLLPSSLGCNYEYHTPNLDETVLPELSITIPMLKLPVSHRAPAGLEDQRQVTDGGDGTQRFVDLFQVICAVDLKRVRHRPGLLSTSRANRSSSRWPSLTNRHSHNIEIQGFELCGVHRGGRCTQTAIGVVVVVSSTIFLIVG